MHTYTFMDIDILCRDLRWKLEDDTWYDLDYHFEICHPGHLCGGDVCQGRSPSLVSEEDCTLQECERAELSHKVSLRWRFSDS